MAPDLCCLIRNRQKKNQNCDNENYSNNRPRYPLLGIFLISVYTHSSMYFPEKSPLKTGNVWYVRICVKLQKMLVRWRRRECWQHAKKKTITRNKFFSLYPGILYRGPLYTLPPIASWYRLFLYLLLANEIRKNMGGCSKNGLESS